MKQASHLTHFALRRVSASDDMPTMLGIFQDYEDAFLAARQYMVGTVDFGWCTVTCEGEATDEWETSHAVFEHMVLWIEPYDLQGEMARMMSE